MFDGAQFWRYGRYPGHHWGRDIGEILGRIGVGDATIIDAPCGDGVVTWWVMRSGVGQRFEAYDIAESSVAVASRMQDWARARSLELRVERRDVHDMPADGPADDVWLLINSLYLLDDIDALIERMRPRVGTIVGVFPHIDSADYRQWLTWSPDEVVNVNEMDEPATIDFFARHGYRLEERRDFCRVRMSHLKSKYVRLAAMLAVDRIEGLLPQREACYWLGVFRRSR
jgi:hypothetical protein